jgi:hypothetical protein
MNPTQTLIAPNNHEEIKIATFSTIRLENLTTNPWQFATNYYRVLR